MRLQFELTEDRVKELDELIERLGLRTRVNLLNEALTLYEWAIHEREAGRIIASVDEKNDRYKEVELPGLPDISDSEPSREIEQSLCLFCMQPIQKIEQIGRSVYALPCNHRLGSVLKNRTPDE